MTPLGSPGRLLSCSMHSGLCVSKNLLEGARKWGEEADYGGKNQGNGAGDACQVLGQPGGWAGGGRMGSPGLLRPACVCNHGRPTPAGLLVISLDPKSPGEMKEPDIQSLVGRRLSSSAAIHSHRHARRRPEPWSFLGGPESYVAYYSVYRRSM